jgi:aspartyl-tRNA(Asn)/glutamyl-tRNA(Gln) amidotransferase subunit A
VGVKDVIDVAGFPTRAGSPLREGHVAIEDAPVVARLRGAGAVILGKTVTTEFACFDPPPTRNPWDLNLDRTPGGSSSGSAVAVAMGMCVAALGTQTGGSLVRPASYCGVSAFKPTFGRLSTEGLVPIAPSLDHVGAIAATAGDLEVVARVLMGWRVPAATGRQSPPTLGLLRSFFVEQADEAMRRAFEEAASRLRAAGAAIEIAELPAGFEQVHAMHRLIMAFEAAEYHRENLLAHRQSYGRNLASMLDEGLSTSPDRYRAALAHLRTFRETIGDSLGQADAWITPATDTTAPASLATTGNPKFQSPWSYGGVPVVSLPCGLAGDGMPAAIQLIARPGDDRRLLQIAQWCEQQLDFRAVPPLLAAESG